MAFLSGKLINNDPIPRSGDHRNENVIVTEDCPPG